MQDLIQLSKQKQTMSSRELLAIINEVRTEFNETPVRLNDFNNRIADELDGDYYENFVVTNPNGTTSNEYQLTLEQCVLVGMRESKAVRRKVLAKLKELEQTQSDTIFTEEGKFKVLQQLADLLNISPIAKETLLITGAEQLLGISIDYRPALSQKLLSAKEIGDKLGISAHMVGKIANHLNLKNIDNGMVVLDKSRYSNKQVDSFKYYAHVVDIMDKHIKEFDIKTDKAKYHE